MTCDDSRIERLEETVEKLREQNEQQAQQIQELTSTVEFLKEDVSALESNLYGEYDSVGASMVTENQGGIFDRVDTLESQDVDLRPEDVINAAPDDSVIPIQEAYNRCKSSINPPEGNKRRAALAWPHFRKYADPTGGTLTLRAPKVKEILRDEVGIDDPNPNTVRRVMRFVAEMSGGDEESQFIVFDTSGKPNKLECSRQAWKDVTGEMMQAVQGPARSPVATDGGETTQ